MNPNDVKKRIEITKKAKEINNRFECKAPSSTRRARVRGKGYYGPLTRAELAKRTAA